MGGLMNAVAIPPQDAPEISPEPQGIPPQAIREVNESLSHPLEVPGTSIEFSSLVTIFAGEFIMGSSKNDADAYSNEVPQREIFLPEYAIGRYPVTNFEYCVFVREGGHAPPFHWRGKDYPEGYADHPVVALNWHDAQAYCAWLSEVTGKRYRLPTETEWEKAARGTEGRTWPWEGAWDPGRCNSGESGIGDTTPVGQYSPAGDSPYGVADMSGNVWEWCSDEYRRYDRILRGGSFLDERKLLRCAYRLGRRPESYDRSIGFRVVAISSTCPEKD